jgi:DNA-binding transcriptional MocR family regulator
MASVDAPDLKPANKLTQIDSVAKSLRAAMFRRTLRAGRRISEAQFAQKLGVSRAQVRRFGTAVTGGLVYRDPRGAAVTRLKGPTLMKSANCVWRSNAWQSNWWSLMRPTSNWQLYPKTSAARLELAPLARLVSST